MDSDPTARKRVYCPHCQDYVSKSLYYHHKQLHYDEDQHQWKTVAPLKVKFEFSPYDQDPAEPHCKQVDAAEALCLDHNLGKHNIDQVLTDDHDSDSSDYDININSNDFDSSDHDVRSDDYDYEENVIEVEAENENMEDSIPRGEELERQKLTRVLLLFLFFWQSLFRISDSAISLMLSFLKQFLFLAGRYLGVTKLHHLAESFPHTMYRAKKCLGRLRETFVRFITCPTCHKLYKYDDCWTTDSNGKKVSKVCSFVRYPKHTQARMRSPCSDVLMKTVRNSNGTVHLAPIKTYCYKSVACSIEELLNRKNLMNLCEEWRNREVVDGKLLDVYDGSVWQSFQYDTDGSPFLAEPHNYLLMLNCDWFQPFTHTQFSIGVLYLAIENLPRNLRFKRQNIICVGILPGPTEPSLNINTYLEPLISDMEKLWEGVFIKVNEKNIKVRAAISCLSCDVPAARKVGGFVGHRGYRNCSKCLKTFPTQQFGDYPDYSGFKKSEWEVRTHGLHVWYARQQKVAKTEGQKKAIESEFGARYSLLYELPYYNAISSCVIDPMHCLFLGIAKKYFKVWMSKDLLSQDDFSTIQARVDAFKCPPDIGHIPYKITSKFAGLKADQWKTWTLHFSLYSLKDILNYHDYNCWLKFVKTCTLICKRNLLISDLTVIDQAVQDFCENFEVLYGKSNLTPNMHLAAHITDSIRCHGPVYSFCV